MAGMLATPVQNGERSPYGGGGGKMRSRRGPKRNATPYDRPAVGRHASAGPQAAALLNGGGLPGDGSRGGVGGGAWIGSRLLGTASKIVTSGASYLYSSFFGRRNVPLLLNEAERITVETADGQADASPSAAEAESTEAGSQHAEEDKTLEVENWMKRNFPRDEADRLIAILRSSAKENGIGEEKTGYANTEVKTTITNQVTAYDITPSIGPQSDAQRWREERTKARQEQKSSMLPGGSGGENSTPVGAGALEDGEAMDGTPIDLARAYMGERVTRVVGPSRVTLTREKVATPLRLSPYQPSPYQLKTRQLGIERDAKLYSSPETKFSTQPESPPVARFLGLPPPVAIRGRDGALNDKLRTPPVSRTIGHLQPTPRTKSPGSALGFPISGESSRKRASSALEDGGYSSGGPIRRLRPRSSLYTPSPASAIQRRGGLGMYPPPPRTLQTASAVKQSQTTPWSRGVETEGKTNVLRSDQRKEENRGSSANLGVHSLVPERASQTARKILETLDMMTPSPQEKSLDTELALVRERPPTELTASMMNDKARLTMQTWEFPHAGEEAGSSGRGRNLEKDLSSVGGSPWKGNENSTKARGKGKAPASSQPPSSQEMNTDQSPLPVRFKEPDSNVANVPPAFGRSKGFQINADVDDSDEESRGANTNMQTANITSTKTTITDKGVNTGTGLFDSFPPKSSSTSIPMFGAPALSESQPPASELNGNRSSSDGKPSVTVTSGGFTFPSSNPAGTTLEPPPTPKPFPSSSLGSAPSAVMNGTPTYKFNTGSAGGNLVLNLPSAVTGGADTVLSKAKFDFKPESKPEFTLSSAPAAGTAVTSQPFSSREPSSEPAKVIEVTKSEIPVIFGATAPGASAPPIAFASTASTFSLSSFGAPGAGAKPGVVSTSSPSTLATGSSSSGQTLTTNSGLFGLNTNGQTSTSFLKTEASFSMFGKTPSDSAPAGTSTLTAVSPPSSASTSGSNNTTAVSTAATAPTFTFGSAPAFGQSKSSFLFGAPSSTPSSAPPVLPKIPSTSLGEDSRPQLNIFGQQKPEVSVVSPVTFGLTATTSNSTTAPSSGGFAGVGSSSAPSPAPFSIPVFGQSSSSSAQGSAVAGSTPPPLFGGTPSSTASNSIISSTTTLPPVTFGSNPNPFGSSTPPSSSFGSSLFGGSNSVPAFGGALSSPAFGASNVNSKPAFVGFTGEIKTQPSPPSVFSGFGAPSNLGASSPSTFSFGAPSSTASASPFSFGGSSAASTSAYTFGASNASASTSPFSFGANPASPPMFGLASSAPAFRSSPNGAMANDGSAENNMEDSMAEEPSSHMVASSPPAQQQTPLLFGAPQTPGPGNFLFGQQPSTPGAATPSPGVFSFGNQTTPVGGNTFTPPPVAANPFSITPQQGQQGALNFNGGGFAVGSSGQDSGTKTNRKFIKAKRTGSVKRK